MNNILYDIWNVLPKNEKTELNLKAINEVMERIKIREFYKVVNRRIMADNKHL